MHGHTHGRALVAEDFSDLSCPMFIPTAEVGLLTAFISRIRHMADFLLLSPLGCPWIPRRAASTGRAALRVTGCPCAGERRRIESEIHPGLDAGTERGRNCARTWHGEHERQRG